MCVCVHVCMIHCVMGATYFFLCPTMPFPPISWVNSPGSALNVLLMKTCLWNGCHLCNLVSVQRKADVKSAEDNSRWQRWPWTPCADGTWDGYTSRCVTIIMYHCWHLQHVTMTPLYFASAESSESFSLMRVYSDWTFKADTCTEHSQSP